MTTIYFYCMTPADVLYMLCCIDCDCIQQYGVWKAANEATHARRASPGLRNRKKSECKSIVSIAENASTNALHPQVAHLIS